MVAAEQPSEKRAQYSKQGTLKEIRLSAPNTEQLYQIGFPSLGNIGPINPDSGTAPQDMYRQAACTKANGQSFRDFIDAVHPEVEESNDNTTAIVAEFFNQSFEGYGDYLSTHLHQGTFIGMDSFDFLNHSSSHFILESRFEAINVEKSDTEGLLITVRREINGLKTFDQDSHFVEEESIEKSQGITLGTLSTTYHLHKTTEENFSAKVSDFELQINNSILLQRYYEHTQRLNDRQKTYSVIVDKLVEANFEITDTNISSMLNETMVALNDIKLAQDYGNQNQFIDSTNQQLTTLQKKIDAKLESEECDRATHDAITSSINKSYLAITSLSKSGKLPSFTQGKVLLQHIESGAAQITQVDNRVLQKIIDTEGTSTRDKIATILEDYGDTSLTSKLFHPLRHHRDDANSLAMAIRNSNSDNDALGELKTQLATMDNFNMTGTYALTLTYLITEVEHSLQPQQQPDAEQAINPSR